MQQRESDQGSRESAESFRSLPLRQGKTPDSLPVKDNPMLPVRLLDEIQAKLDEGDDSLDADEFAAAIGLYQQAVVLLPDPKHLHDVSLPVFTALGEAFFFAGHYRDALTALKQAEKAPGGVENPLLHLRLGQAYYEIGDLERAGDALARAYALDGRDVFDGEDDKYLSFLATRIEF